MQSNHKKHTLENGLTLITVPMAGVQSVTGLLLVGVGSRYEEKGVNGLSHFFEHMAFKGTKKRPTALEIAEEIDSVGALNNAYTGKEYTGYYIKAAAKHLGMIVDVLSDMVLNSLFKKEEIEKEKGVILEEINMYEDLPQAKVGKNFESLLYKGTSLGRQILGDKKNIKEMGRKDFVEYMGKWYQPENAVFVVAGGIKETQTRDLVEEKFASWNQISPIGSLTQVTEKQAGSKLDLETKDTEQSHIILGVRAYKRGHKLRYALGVLSIILGGGMSSRLFHEVREKRGLAYYVGASAQRYADVGYLAASAGVDKERIDESIEVILEQFDILRKGKVGVKELNKAKEYVKGGLILGHEDSHNVADMFAGTWILEGKIRTLEQTIREIDKVTAEEVQEVAREIFVGEKLNLAVIGQFEDRHRFEKLLKF